MILNTLNASNIPLNGLHLIEASAGSGKTYTIANIFVRLLLEKQVNIDELLVVTFTRAATHELRERLRRRLQECIALLQGQPVEDVFLQSLVSTIEHKTERLQHMQDQLLRIDEAPILTIHGFCQRVMQEHAFTSAVSFELEVVHNADAIQAMAMRDFWRNTMAHTDEVSARAILKNWSSPDTLLADIKAALNKVQIAVYPPQQVDLNTQLDQTVDLYKKLCQEWQSNQPKLHDFIFGKRLNRRSYNNKVSQSACDAMVYLLKLKADKPQHQLQLACTPKADFPEKYLARWTHTQLSEKLKQGETLEDSCLFQDMETYLLSLKQIASNFRAKILREALDFIKHQQETRRHETLELNFDDLISGVHQALYSDKAESLQQQLLKRHPYALIDEFQDTDPLQYGIFRKIYYDHARHSPNSALYLIGDPKQAIYSFRGADLPTYIQARKDVFAAINAQEAAGAWSLDKNWRSSPQMIAALNLLFTQIDDVFLYQPHIQYQAVTAARDAVPVTLENKALSALEIRYLQAENGKSMSKARAREAAAQLAAQDIATILENATLDKQPVIAADIAILVRSHNEAELMRDALNRAGVQSVNLSRRHVFETHEAALLLDLLHYLIKPDNIHQLLAILADDWFQYDAVRLAELQQGGSDWEQLRLSFRRYKALWQEKNLLAMIFHLLHEQHIAKGLLASNNGHRKLTNLLHLAEVLHQKATEDQASPEALLHWFESQMHQAHHGEERLLRLETDQALVKIVTQHASKGLEYPFVFLPFPWSGTQAINNKSAWYHEAGQNWVDWGSDQFEAHQALQQTEQLAEQLRLAYVALTRAKYRSVLYWGDIRDIKRSAMARIIFADTLENEKFDHSIAMAHLQKLQEQSQGDICIQSATVSDDDAENSPQPLPQTRQAQNLKHREFKAAINQHWRVRSYSGLIANRDEPHDREENADQTAPPIINPIPDAIPDAVFRLPGGVNTGLCLHSILENMDFQTTNKEQLDSLIKQQMLIHDLAPEWADSILQIIQQTLATPLGHAADCALKDISANHCLVEMGFNLSIADINLDDLKARLSAFPDHATIAQGLENDSLYGMMSGFIDLIFRHQGRYYLLDYKSNKLGDQLVDYHSDQLEEAMRQHHYDLQYLLYSLALHRFLQFRLAAYDYEQHFGGIYYLFMRGMRPALGAESGVYYQRLPKDLITSIDQLLQENTNVSLA